MTTESAIVTEAPIPQSPSSPHPRLRIPFILLSLYWLVILVTYLTDIPTFNRFLLHMGALLVVILVFLIWWSFNRSIPRRDRLHILAAAIVAPVFTMLLADKTMGPMPLFNGLPILFTAWALWLLLARRACHHIWKRGLITLICLSIGVFALFRMEGLKGEGAADFKWRFSPTPEERYLAQRSATTLPVEPSASALSLRPGDWPAFRGIHRDSVVRDVSISTDWNANPPRQIWRRPIGPGWSSMILVDGKLFTQEQRGDNEATVCLDASTGNEIWSHQESGRFWDALSAAGPRATPTFDNGRIYSQGATGILLCLDAATGQRIWSRNTLEDSGAKLPDWGIASSPLVADGVVIVYSAGQGGKALLAYKADTGALAWTANAGMYSYASAHLATLRGVPQALFISDKGLLSVEPSTGKTLWEYPAQAQPPRSLQPLIVNDTDLLVPLGMEAPTDLISVTKIDDTWTATKRWTSRNLKPSFNDFVLHDNHVYGFDGAIFTCVELSTGNRKWKKGRYGTGQVLLLKDQPLLLVLADDGRIVLVNANPAAFEEVGFIQGIEGKTWNHPILVGSRVYVRNAQEMACYELTRRP